MDSRDAFAIIRPLRLDGWTLQAIADTFDPPITRERVRQIWNLHASSEDRAALAQVAIDRERERVEELAERAGRARRRRAGKREDVIVAIQEWAELFGAPPSATDWQMASPRHNAKRYASTGREWPRTTTVQSLFGSWNTAIRAAGFSPRRTGEWNKTYPSNVRDGKPE